MPALIITSLDSEFGSTAITSGLGRQLQMRDRNLALVKAYLADQNDGDAGLYRRLFPNTATPQEQKSGMKAKEVAALVAGLTKSVANGVSLIEGKPNDAPYNLELAELIDARVLLVSSGKDDAATIVETVAQYGSRLSGIMFNGVPEYRKSELQRQVIPTLAAAGIKSFGVIGEDSLLLAPTVEAVRTYLEANYVSDSGENLALLENFLVGGMILDWGPTYFNSRSNVGVVVRGDRPDIQLAALQSNTVAALILSKGIPPVEYVLYEADTRKIPIMVVPGSTIEVAEQLGNLPLLSEFEHDAKLQRISDLLEQHADIAAINDLLATPATA